MKRSPFLAASAAALLLAALPALAGPGSTGMLTQVAGTLILTTPDPPNITVVPCDALNGIFVAPDSPEPLPATHVMVSVRNSNNQPISNAIVVFEVDPDIVLCPGANFTGTTDGDGIAYVDLHAGGCARGALSGIIKANGVTIRAYENVVSPDFDGAGSDHEVNLADLVVFAEEFSDGVGGCHDYDDSSLTDLGDLVLFSPAFVARNRCP